MQTVTDMQKANLIAFLQLKVQGEIDMDITLNYSCEGRLTTIPAEQSCKHNSNWEAVQACKQFEFQARTTYDKL